jgi:hypothetical protein
MSLWTKFPNAYFYVHYARGCTLLESYYLSIASPLQILLVGEPLARPWLAPFRVSLVSLQDSPLRAKARFQVVAVAPRIGVGLRYRYYLDGRLIPGPPSATSLEVDTARIADGYHELRAVAYTSQPVSHQAFAVHAFTVGNHGREAVLRGIRKGTMLALEAPLTLTVEAAGTPIRRGVLHHQRRQLDSDDRPGEVTLEPAWLGPGPIRLQGFAEYEDGMEVRTPPVQFQVVRKPHAENAH